MSKRPYVFSATPHVLRQAEQVAPGIVIETEIEEAILRGEVERDYEAGPKAWRVTGDGWVAKLHHHRRRSPLGTCYGWALFRVERQP